MFTLSLPRTLAGALLLSGATTAQAATLLVTVKADAYDGVCNLHCSLRDAVAVANQSGTANTIVLPSGTYTLTRLDSLDGAGLPIDEDGSLSGDLDIVGELRIKGAGRDKTTIKGPTDAYLTLHHRLLEVHPNARLVLEDLNLKDGHSAYNGGAVENHGYLLLRDMRVEENIARARKPLDDPLDEEASSGRGGAIANYGDLTVLASHIRFNGAEGFRENNNSGLGGAIYNRGSLRVSDTHFQENYAVDESYAGSGAAIYSKGLATVERSSFILNYVDKLSDGGAITNEGGGVLKLTNSTLSYNSVSALVNGLNDLPGQLSKATLNNVTITSNDDFGYYAVVNWSDLRIRNSVIAGNRDLWSGGGANCINQGSNFSYQAIGLLRNDEEGNCNADYFVPFDQTFTKVLSARPTEQSNSTWAQVLRPGSPAIDAGIGNYIAKDQRGVSRPKDGNGDGVAVCDLGAYELIP